MVSGFCISRPIWVALRQAKASAAKGDATPLWSSEQEMRTRPLLSLTTIPAADWWFLASKAPSKLILIACPNGGAHLRSTLGGIKRFGLPKWPKAHYRKFCTDRGKERQTLG